MTCTFCKHSEYAAFYNDDWNIGTTLLVCEIKNALVDYDDSCKGFKKEGK